MLCQALPSGPGFPDDNNLKLYTQLIHAANHKLTIANPYFVPDDALLTAITSAAQRGVDVTLISSEIGDQFLVYNAQRSYYEQLLRAGVKVYLYQSPILLHSKHLSVDDDIAVIGSSNMDLRSFTLNLEVLLLCYDKERRRGHAADLRRLSGAGEATQPGGMGGAPDDDQACREHLAPDRGLAMRSITRNFVLAAPPAGYVDALGNRVWAQK